MAWRGHGAAFGPLEHNVPATSATNRIMRCRLGAFDSQRTFRPSIFGPAKKPGFASRQVPTGGGYNAPSAISVRFGLKTLEPLAVEVTYMSPAGLRV